MFGFVAEKLMFPGPPDCIKRMNDGLNRIFIEASGSKYVILYSHGNSANIGINRKIMENLSQLSGMSICLYEYPGYTEGQGSSQEKANKAIEDCLNWLLYVKNYEISQIILMGRSIGSGPTLWLASNPHIDKEFAGIILWSAFSSIQDLGLHIIDGIWKKEVVPLWVKCFANPAMAYFATSRLAIGNRYNNVEAIAAVHENVPLLFIHGRMDEIVPIRCMELLKEAAPKSTLHSEHIQDLGDHNVFDDDALFLSVVDFLNKIREKEIK